MMKQILFWSPRILTILFALFTSHFALDVFDAKPGSAETVTDLIMHLIPTIVITAALIISWKWEWVGGVVFLVFAVLYMIITWGRFPFLVYVLVSGPLALISNLFFLNWIYRTEIRSKEKTGTV
jgi:hypothetical protein